MRKEPNKTGRQVQFLNDNELKTPSYTDKMRVKIDSPIGRRQYSKRFGAIEPIFGNIKVNKGMKKFTFRGQEKVNAQWQIYCNTDGYFRSSNIIANCILLVNSGVGIGFTQEVDITNSW